METKKIAEDEYQEIIKHIKSKTKGGACPFCGAQYLEVHREILSIIITESIAGRTSFIYIKCVNCYIGLLFDLNAFRLKR